MPNYKSRSDDQIWWESQPGNRGKTYPGDDIASKQYERNKAAGENNASIAKSFFGRLTGKSKSASDAKPDPKEFVSLGKSYADEVKAAGNEPRVHLSNEGEDWDPDEKPVSLQKRGGSIKKYAKGGKISLDNCKVSTHQKSKKHPNW